MTGIHIDGGITIGGNITISLDYGIPINTVAPVISVATPNVRVGKTATTTNGTWTLTLPISGYYYQWNSNAAPITGATANTYVVQSSDLTQYLTCDVTAYTSAGNSVPAMSNSLGPVLPAIVDPDIADYVDGGYYAGRVTWDSIEYYLIVAGNGAAYGTGVINPDSPAGAYYPYNGYTDWFVPTESMLGQMCVYKTQFATAGQAYSTSIGQSSNYLSCTIGDAGLGYVAVYFATGYACEHNTVYSPYTGYPRRLCRLQVIPT